MTRSRQPWRAEQKRRTGARTIKKKRVCYGSRLRNVERGNRVAGWVVYNTTVRQGGSAPRRRLVAGAAK